MRALRRLYQLQEEALQAARQASQEKRPHAVLACHLSHDVPWRSRIETYRAIFSACQHPAQDLSQLLAELGYHLISTMHAVFDCPDGWAAPHAGCLRDLPIPMHFVYRHEQDGSEILYVAGEMEDAFHRPEQQVHLIGRRQERFSILQIWRGAKASQEVFERGLKRLAEVYDLKWEQTPALKAVGM